MVDEVEAARSELKPAERRLLGLVRPLADARIRAWRGVAGPDDARAAFLRITAMT